jgi:hypothetical protein
MGIDSLQWCLESPEVFLCVAFQPNLLFGAGTERPGPNDTKLCLVFPVLNYDQAPNFELATDRTQPNSGPADVESMDEFRIGIAGNVVAGDSYGQHCPGSV